MARWFLATNTRLVNIRTDLSDCPRANYRSLRWQHHRQVFMAMAANAKHQENAICRSDMMPGFLRWIKSCNNGEAPLSAGAFVPFNIDGNTVGYISQR